MATNFSRRDFLKAASLASAGLAFSTNSLSAKSYRRILGANERVNFAIIGLHGRGYGHLSGLADCKSALVTHICDVDKRELEPFALKVQEKFSQLPAQAKDYRTLLDLKDVDAITICTPEHWHTHMAIMGLQAGKHVYVEKPPSHNPAEGELLVQAQKEYGKLVQMGNQQRSSLHTIEAIQKIREGVIGKVYYGKAWYCNERKSIGIGKEVAVPDYLDWELWQGPAPRRAYRDNIHPYNWHWFWNWGTGETLNNGTHEVDVCLWALDVKFPLRVSASGGRYHFKDDWEFYDTLVTNYEYEDKMITWEGRSCQGKKYFGRGRGAMIHGTEGAILIDRDGYEIYNAADEKVFEYAKQEKDAALDTTGEGPLTTAHFQNFINAITLNEKLHSPIAEGNVSVTMLQLSNIAWKVGRVLRLNAANGHILKDKQAMKMWRREYERGWELKL